MLFYANESLSLVIAGENDKATPLALNKIIFEAFPNPKKKLIIVPNAGHNDLLTKPGVTAQYCSFMTQFQ